VEENQVVNRYDLAICPHRVCPDNKALRTGKEIRFRFWLSPVRAFSFRASNGVSEDKAGKEAKRRPTGW